MFALDSSSGLSSQNVHGLTIEGLREKNTSSFSYGMVAKVTLQSYGPLISSSIFNFVFWFVLWGAFPCCYEYYYLIY